MKSHTKSLASVSDRVGLRSRRKRGRGMLAAVLVLSLVASGCGKDAPKEPDNAPLPGQEGS